MIFAAISYAMGNVSWIDTDDIPVWTGNEPGHFDPSHYDSQGQIILGNRFANEFIVTPEPATMSLVGAGMLTVLRRRRDFRRWV